MTKTFKNAFALLLIFSLVALPLRAVFAMPMIHSDNANTSSHCKDMAMMMNQSTEDMSSIMATNGNDAQSIPANDDDYCCKHCDTDCSGCIHTLSISETDILHLLNQYPHTYHSEALIAVQSQKATPPFRPPLLRTI